MSEVREHYNSTLLSLDNKMDPEFQVGDQVRNMYSSKYIGLVLEIISENKCKVLWGEYHGPYPYSWLVGEGENNRMFWYSSTILRKVIQ